MSVDAPHLGHHIAEELFCFNERALTEGARFAALLPKVIEKGLTYTELIGPPTAEGLPQT